MLPHLSREHFISLDEIHIKQEGVPLLHDNFQIRFPRDPKRYYNPSATNILMVQSKEEHVRYFITQGKNITIPDYNKNIKDKIGRVKGLSSINSARASNSHPDGNTDIFEGSSILNIPKLGVNTANKLQELETSTVGQLKNTEAPNINDHAGI